MPQAFERHRHGFTVERVTHLDGWPCWHVAQLHGTPHPRWTGNHYRTLDAALDAVTPIVGALRSEFRNEDVRPAIRIHDSSDVPEPVPMCCAFDDEPPGRPAA